MELKNTTEALNRWAKAIVQEARQNAVREFGPKTRLKDKLGYKVKANPNSITIKFFPGYASFVDKGVRGNTGLLKNGRKDSPFQYKDKMPPPAALDQWVIKQDFLKSATRDKGKFKSRQSLKFAIAKNIQKYGIKQTLFFTTPFDKYFKELPAFITERFGSDVVDYYTTAFKDSITDQFEIQVKKRN